MSGVKKQSPLRRLGTLRDDLAQGKPMRSKKWRLLLLGLFVVLLISGLLLLAQKNQATTAMVYSDGVLVAALDLSTDQTYTVTYGDGYNVITVADGGVTVTEATCPDHVCMLRGSTRGGAPIICLPNRLVIKLTTSGTAQEGVDVIVQ